MSRKRFDLFPIRYVRAPLTLPTEELDTDFKRKYPPDAQLGEELAENARVWKVYRDEAIQHDDGVLAGWNNTIDILLTFAGLFSAAVTAFVVESYQFLQPAGLDFGAAFYALAVNDTETLHALAVSTSRPGSTARWINGLWFTSLFFALAAAFLCILVKQWLDEYTARTRASSQNPKHWSRRRAFYFCAIDNWGVAGIISLLPLLLHAALFLFFAGMVVLLWSLSRAVATWLSGLAGLLFCLYSVSVLIPVWNAACPFATPVAKQLRRAWNFLGIWLLRRGVTLSESAAALAARWRYFWSSQPDLEAACPHPRSIKIWKLHKAMQDSVGKSLFDQILHIESLSSNNGSGPDASVPRLVDELDYDALRWLILSVSDSDTNAVGIQALGALEPYTPLAVLASRGGLRHNVSDNRPLLASPAGGSVVEAARVIRSLLALDAGGLSTNAKYLGAHVTAWVYWDRIPRNSTYPYMQLLQYALTVPMDLSRSFGDRDYILFRNQAAKWERTPSLHSTSMLLITLKCLTRHHMLLFLLCSDLGLVSSTQWHLILPKLRNNTSPCPRHARDTGCDLRCFTELISSFMLQESTEDLDPLVLTQLFEATCRYLSSHFVGSRLSELPTFLTYLVSVRFISRNPSHSVDSASHVTFWISIPDSWDQSPCVDPLWFHAWRHAAYLCRLNFASTYTPTELIAFALSKPADQHTHNTAYSLLEVSPFDVPSPLDAILRAILLSEGDAGRLVPSFWDLLFKEMDDFFNPGLVTAAEALATSLCTFYRNTEHVHDFVLPFFAPLTFRHVMAQMYLLWPRESNDVSLVFPTRALTFCSHIMELRSLWWIEGLNLLSHEDADLEVRYPIVGSTSVSDIQSYASALTEECLRRGPCYDCPLTVAPLAFDISLRTFTVNPFGVYPIVDTEEDG